LSANHGELAPEDLRHAREDVDVLDGDGGPGDVDAVDQARAYGNERHAEVILGGPLAEVRPDERLHLARAADGRVEAFGDGVERDVVVRGADAAAREDHLVAPPELVQIARDDVDLVGADDDTLEADAEGEELLRDERGV